MTPTPGMPKSEEVEVIPQGVADLRNLYTIYYLRGGAHQTHQKNFFHSGGPTEMRVIIERAKRHCEVMSYRFIKVTPFVNDLKHDEKLAAERD